MNGSYEQMELDMTGKLSADAQTLTSGAIQTIKALAADYIDAPTPVRNRHEAYGHAAEHLARIATAVKRIKDDTALLLATLSDPNLPALEAASSICNSTAEAAKTLLVAAAEMSRVRDDLYDLEKTDAPPSPLDDLAAMGDFEEAPENHTGNDNETED